MMWQHLLSIFFSLTNFLKYLHCFLLVFFFNINAAQCACPLFVTDNSCVHPAFKHCIYTAALESTPHRPAENEKKEKKKLRAGVVLTTVWLFHAALPRSDEGVMQEAYESERRFCMRAMSVCITLPLSSLSNVKANATAKADRLRYLTLVYHEPFHFDCLFLSFVCSSEESFWQTYGPSQKH